MTLARIFFDRTIQLGSKCAVKYKESKGAPYTEMSWNSFAGLVRSLAFGLAALGLEPGERAAILSQTSHFWVASDLAVLSNRAVSVPLYPTCSQDDIEFIITNSSSKIVFVQNEALLKRVLKSDVLTSHLEAIVVFQAPDRANWRDESKLPSSVRVLTIQELAALGQDFAQSNREIIENRIQDSQLEDLATIIYTSGTTGTPKGCMLRHSTILAVLDDLATGIIPVSEADVYLSYLPLSHVFERVAGEYYWMHSGGTCAFAEGLEYVAKNMAEIQPTMLLVVPRILDRIYAKVSSGIDGASPRAKQLINWAIEVGKEKFQHQIEGSSPRLGLLAKYFLAEKLVFKKLRERIGKNIRMIVSGGAPATSEVIQFFNAIGIPVLEGYGLTETAAPLTVNRLHLNKPGTVGSVLPSVELKIADDGEILAKGPTIFDGYFGADELNNQVFEDGYFRTGDLGAIDAQGYLKITGRKKDLIINSAGKNIAPQRIENIMKTLPMTNQVVVFGDKKKHLVALITLDESQALEFAKEKSWSVNSMQELSQHPELLKLFRDEIKARSAELADYERIRNFRILERDFSVEEGELTATLKVKRNIVSTKYFDIIESLYDKEESVSLISSKR